MVRPSYSIDPPVVVAPASDLASRAEVPGAAGELETDQVGAEQALDDLGPPRQPHEQLDRRERDVQEEADPHVRPQPAEQLGDELQLVVVHPDGRAGRRELGRRLGEPRVDLSDRTPTSRDGTAIRRQRRGRAATGSRWRSPRSSRRLPRSVSVTGCRLRPSLVVGSRMMSGDPGQPIQAPWRRDRIGASAVTSPPGACRALVVPSGSFSMSNGSRLATTTICACAEPDESPGAPGRHRRARRCPGGLAGRPAAAVDAGVCRCCSAHGGVRSSAGRRSFGGGCLGSESVRFRSTLLDPIGRPVTPDEQSVTTCRLRQSQARSATG